MDIYAIRQALSAGKTIYDLPLRVTYYARVSTDKDAQLHSLSAQVSYYSGFIQKNQHWTFVEGYIDEGISGTSVSRRENFLRMIEDAKAHRFDFIVTKEISRFSRNTLDSIRYTQELLACGVGVLFQSDNINTLLPDAELRLTIMSSIAQDEVRKISERVRFGFKRAIENGVVLGSSRIWGYRKQEGRLVIDEEEAKIVRLIFDLYANQLLGIRGVAARLSELGYQNSSGNSFSFSTIRGILSNPKYKGWYCGGKTSKVDYKLKAVKQFAPEEWLTYRDEEAVPAIVPEELWDRANDILARRSAKQSARDKSSYQNKYPYSGKILCGVHHVPYYRSLYRFKTCEKEVWRCREYVKSGKSGCTGPTLYTEELDSIMRQCLEEVLPDRTGFIREMVQLYSGAGPSARLEGELAQKRKSADALLKRKDKLLDLNVSGCISDGEFTLRNRRFNEELEALEAELKALEAEKRRCRDTAQSAETLGQAIAEELSFPGGFSQLVLDALLDHLDVVGEADGRIRVSVWLKGRTEGEAFTIHRRRGCPSVCSRAYI